MRETKKKARKDEKLIAYLISQGKLTSEQAEELKTSGPSETAEDRSRQAEAVLAFVERPGSFIVKTCKREECGEAFSTNYRSVGYCSDTCRAKALMKIGVQWDRQKSTEERWGGVPPLVVPPSALRALKELLSQVPDKNHLPEDRTTAPESHTEPRPNHSAQQYDEQTADGQSTYVQTNPPASLVELDFPGTLDLDDLSQP